VSRGLDTVDTELRLVAEIRRTCREHDWPVPSCQRADGLLDERTALIKPSVGTAVDRT
jgi:hypothetical protein